MEIKVATALAKDVGDPCVQIVDIKYERWCHAHNRPTYWKSRFIFRGDGVMEVVIEEEKETWDG
jgi:hypothetical protein